MPASSSSASTARLVLLSPSGAVVRTIAGSVPTDTSLEDVRHDGRRVITARGTGSSTRFTVFDVAAGTSTSFVVAGGVGAHFTDQGILTHESTGRIALRDDAGRWIKTFPALPKGSGVGLVLVSPGGTLLMQETSTGIVLRRTSNGSVVRTIPNPRGATCLPLGLWGQGYVKMSCSDPDRPSNWVRAVSTTSSTSVDVTSRSLYAYSNAWPTTGRRTVEYGPNDPQVGSDPGPTFRRDFPQIDVTYGLGVHGSRVWVRGLNGTVMSEDVRTGQVVTLAGPGSALDGYVTGERLIDTTS